MVGVIFRRNDFLHPPRTFQNSQRGSFSEKNFSELPTNGRGVRKNCQLALKYLHKSAELGSPKARKILKKMESVE